MPELTNNITQAPGIELNIIPNEINIPGSPEILIRTVNDYITYEVSAVVPYIDSEDLNFYPIFYVPNVKCFIIEARCKYGTASTSGKLTVEKLTSGTAKGSGLSMLASTFDLSLGANITQHRGSTTVFAGTQLNPGDAIALRPSGTLTNLRNVSITCLFGVNLKDLPSGQSVTAIISGI